MSTSAEAHAHGDPLLEAALRHDKEVEEHIHKQQLKETYDKHAILMEHERSGALIGGPGMWYFDDVVSGKKSPGKAPPVGDQNESGKEEPHKSEQLEI